MKLLPTLLVLVCTSAQATVNATLSSEFVSGDKRICVYTHNGSIYTKSQNKIQYCRSVLRVNR